MTDLIDRQDAIDAVNAYLGLSAVSRTIQNMTSIQEILEKLPSAQERKTGRWIKTKDEKINAWWWSCSECGNYPLKSVFNRNDDLSDFCPHCGARMEVEHE